MVEIEEENPNAQPSFKCTYFKKNGDERKKHEGINK